MSAPFLFVSHVSEDKAHAKELVTELERRGVACWIAPRDVRAGKPYDDEIAEAIDDCAAMLLIFSERCNESHYIRREITVAGEAQKLIIPFRIEDAQPKKGLRIRLADLHWIDGFIAREQAIDTLIRSVAPNGAGRLRNPEPDTEAAHLPPTSPAPPETAASSETRQQAPEPVSSVARTPAEAASAPAETSGERELREMEASPDPEDQFMAGVMHRVGFASQSSWGEALPFLHRAAKQGHAGAEHQIGVRMLDGRTTELHKREAADWFSSAAAKNHTSALCDLAQLYESGQGVGKDSEKALELYRQAVASGAFWAERDEERLAGRPKKNVPTPFAEYDASLVASEGEFASFTDIRKQEIDGSLLDAGLSRQELDLNDSATVAARASGGDAYALFALGYTHFRDQQHPKARYWLQRSAVKGFAPAQRIVGTYYMVGFDTVANKPEAVGWFERAARSGSTMALLDLAGMYLHGDGIPRDLAKAIFFCDEVIARGKYFETAYYTRKYARSQLTKS